MTKLNRVTGKIFGETANASGADPEIGQFGSGKIGTYQGTGDIATIQGLTAWSNGWIDAVTPNQQFPALPEMTGVHKVLSYQIAYLLQNGVPEWDINTTYYTNQFCRYSNKFYCSLSDNNTGNNPSTDTGNWIAYGGANQDLSNLSETGLGKFVQRSGDTMSGNLNVGGSSEPNLSTQSNSVQYNVAPDTSSTYGYTQMLDSNGQWMGIFGVERYTDNRTIVKMQGYDAAGTDARIQLVSNGSGTWYAQAPASGAMASNSIVVTTALSRNSNGYYKLGNGLIIQWGYVQATSTTQPDGVTVTLPTAFSSANSYMIGLGLHTSSSAGSVDFNDFGVHSKTTTNFKMRMENTTYVQGCDWIAIGY